MALKPKSTGCPAVDLLISTPPLHGLSYRPSRTITRPVDNVRTSEDIPHLQLLNSIPSLEWSGIPGRHTTHQAHLYLFPSSHHPTTPTSFKPPLFSTLYPHPTPCPTLPGSTTYLTLTHSPRIDWAGAIVPARPSRPAIFRESPASLGGVDAKHLQAHLACESAYLCDCRGHMIRVLEMATRSFGAISASTGRVRALVDRSAR